jgi:uncharacterized protein YhjY with autotransporter beta-barrel domain
LVSATFQDVQVTGFDETNAGAANLRIGTQSRKSQVWSGGVRASMNFEGWSPWVRVTADKERNDDARFVTAMPLSLLATGNSYDIQGYPIDSTYTTIQAGVHTWFARNIGFGVSYYNVSGRSNITEWGASAALTYKF